MEMIQMRADRCAEFGIDSKNFRIDSTGWRILSTPNGIRVKTDDKWEITEFLEGEFAGEQLFTLDAALRETNKAGKRMPTRSEWNVIVGAIVPAAGSAGEWIDDSLIRESLALTLPGYRDSSSGAHYYQGGYGNYWAAPSPNASQFFGPFLSVSRGQFHPVTRCIRTLGYSVRCFTT